MTFGDLLRPRRGLWKRLVRRADLARDEGRYRTAAELYAEAIALRPDRASTHVQRGNMLKESGQIVAAEQAYRRAAKLGAEASDLALQMGHLFKVAGRWDDARREYRRAASLKPDWRAPADELAALRHALTDRYAVAREGAAPAETDTDFDRVVPMLAPGADAPTPVDRDGEIAILRCGRQEYGRWGIQRTLRGIEAIQGYAVAASTLDEVRVIVNGVELWREALCGPYATRAGGPAAKYVFNCWVDLSAFQPGLHTLELRFVAFSQVIRSWHERIAVETAEPASSYPGSSALVDPDVTDPRSVEAQVRSLPSRVHAAERRLFSDGVRRVLVLRVDQLGDMIASIPALERLRQLLPNAQIVLLATRANADLAQTLPDLVDEVIEADFPDDPAERRRIMPLPEQKRLRDMLHSFEFDIAIDLAQADVSRPLLLLSGARFLYGMGGQAWPFLSASFSLDTHDRWTGQDVVPHATKVLAMVEAVGALLREPMPARRRADLTHALLEPLGLGAATRYAVLHTGARIGFSRWPHYGALVELLLRRTGLTLVVIGDAAQSSGVASAHSRIVTIDRHLPFDQFDALLSLATVVVGNDSGPKHLAALRKTATVTIFSARIDWREWGQEREGTIITRQIPCAGCAILHEPENCGKRFACITDITPREVADIVCKLEREVTK